MSLRNRKTSHVTTTQSHAENQWPPYPPPSETELEKALRIEEETKAKQISDAIDHVLESEGQAMRRKQKSETRFLLLGQSESGKSTMLKNFQLQFTPKALQAESDAWRAVIHLNLVRSVNFILDLLSNVAAAATSAQHASQFENTHIHTYASGHAPGRSFGGNTSPTKAAFHTSPTQQWTGDSIRRYKLTLSPLRQVEMILAKQLSVQESSRLSSPDSHPNTWIPTRAPEVSVRSGRGWKLLLRRRTQEDVPNVHYPEALENARHILDACREDIGSLWASLAVQRALKAQGIVLQEQSGFFLDWVDRVAHINYEPTSDDILRARLQTMGVEEHRLIMETAEEKGQQWIFYDVGGSRGQRASWVPFFEDVNAIIFLCSTAGFSEVLLEDRSANRLLDSFKLWKTICSSKLLEAVQFILLLNKTDILSARLKAGMQFSSFVKSYKDPNDTEHVTGYLKDKFIAMHHHNSPQRRQLHVHCTCAIDIDLTSAVLMRIRDAIIVHHLVATDML